MDKPRILLLTPAYKPNLGGVETHLEDLTDYLNANSYRTTVLTYQPITTPVTGKSFEKNKNITVRRFNWISGNYFHTFVNLHPVFNFLYLTPYLFVRTFFYLLKHRDDYDMIHAIGLSTSFSARIFKMIFNIPYVYTSENLYFFPKNSLYEKVGRWALKDAEVLLGHSEQSAEELKTLIGSDSRKVTVFNHWVNQKKFKPQNRKTLKKKLKWQDKFTVLYVGRLIPEKGIKVFIEAAKKVKSDMQFKVIGDDGPELPAVRKVAKNLDNFEYVGPVPYENLSQYYAASDIFVYPALYEEDVARTLIEAMSCGTPVVNTNPGSGAYKLTSEVGFVIKPSAIALAKVLDRVNKNKKLWTKLSKGALKFSKNFGDKLAEVVTSSYDSVYKTHKNSELDKLLANTGDLCLKRRSKEIINGLNPTEKHKVLDAGCGDGFFLHLLAELGNYDLTGLDDNPKALALAKKYVKSKKLKLVEGDVLNMPFRDNSFDRIICSEVLEHLPNDIVGLKEFKRVMKKGGLVAITVPCHNYPFFWDPLNWVLEHTIGTHVKSGFWAGLWNQHFRLYTSKTLRKAVEDAGLEVLDIKGVTHYCLPFNHYLLNIGYRLRKSDKIDKKTEKSLSKFSTKRPKQKGIYQRFLDFANWIDRFNNREFSLKNRSVGVFVLAKKP